LAHALFSGILLKLEPSLSIRLRGLPPHTEPRRAASPHEPRQSAIHQESQDPPIS
jgi:hypothetical protein